MARRELSSTLKNLKFMQRAVLREGKPQKEDEVKPDGNFPSNSTITRRCVVIMEGDPHPGVLKGRMSFQSFNPSVDKLNKEARLNQAGAEAETTVSKKQNEKVSFRENNSSVEGPECSNLDKKCYEASGKVKRKQGEVICEAQYPNKSCRNYRGNRVSSPKNGSVSFRKPMGDKLEWNVLRPLKCQTK